MVYTQFNMKSKTVVIIIHIILVLAWHRSCLAMAELAQAMFGWIRQLSVGRLKNGLFFH